jgi:peroxiredoxin
VLNTVVRFFVLWLASLPLAGVLRAAETPPSPLGRTIAHFKLQDYLGSQHSLADWQDKHAVVVVFLGTECPLARLYGPRLAEMAKQYEPKGAAFVGIDSNQQDSLTEIAHYARVHGIDFPLLKDPGNRVADQFGAVRTPEAFVLDRQRVVRYWGRIDDQYGVGYSRGERKRSDLAVALEEVLAGKPVATPISPSVGCHIGRVNRKPPTGDITWSGQIAAIFERRCLECHRPGQVGPFALTTYQDTLGWGPMIREGLQEGRMPPWHASHEFGKFSNDRSLPAEEKRLIVEWIDNGMPEGMPLAAPPEKPFIDGWRISKPDLELKMPKSFTVPAKGTIEYQYFVVDPGFTEDVWIKQAEARPGNRAVIHHFVLFFVPPGRNPKKGTSALFNTIAIYAPGLPASIFPPGMAKRIPAGSRIGFEMHYTPNGSEQVDCSSAGLVFADRKQVKKELLTVMAVNADFRIPPGADDYRVEAEYRFDQDMRLFSMLPHMHLRGKSFRFDAIYPDGRKETLLDVPRYDFNWQYSYALAEPKRMPEGTVIHCTAAFDNSEHNLANPDPLETVGWGDETTDEMMVGRMQVMREDQDLTVGMPQVQKLAGGDYEVTFYYRPDSGVKTVQLAGDFNDWQPEKTPLGGPDRAGRFSVKLKLAPGDYGYRFLLDGERWRSDPGNPEQAGFYNHSVLHLGP